jgi:ABC-type dipeptide/oligopeptide/nickel transport system permease component
MDNPEMKQPQPIGTRFWAWVDEVVGSRFTRFGRTTTGSPVGELLADRMPTTIGIGIMAWAAAWSGGLVMAAHLAIHRPRMARWVQNRMYPIFQAVPLAAVALGGFLITVRLGLAGDRVAGLLAGWVTLTVAIFPSTLALWLTTLQPVISAEYVRAARARGLAAIHVWRTIILPTCVARGGLLPQMGFSLGAMLIGSIVVENVFGMHGTGELFAKAVLEGESELAATATLIFVVPLALWLTTAETLVLVLDPEQGGRL